MEVLELYIQKNPKYIGKSRTYFLNRNRISLMVSILCGSQTVWIKSQVANPAATGTKHVTNNRQFKEKQVKVETRKKSSKSFPPPPPHIYIYIYIVVLSFCNYLAFVLFSLLSSLAILFSC
jgi:hypothetical protein